MNTPVDRNASLKRVAKTLDDYLDIVRHPAFRLGAIDVARNSPFDSCDRLPLRIIDETPKRARGIWACGWPASDDIELAQRRYEEGRQVVVGFGLKIRSWADPRFPPKVIRDWCERCARGIGTA